jgi:hypothetical protein
MATSRAIGCDVGTMFYQTAEKQADNSIKIQNVRNAFVEMAFTEDSEDTFKRNGWHYIRDGDRVYIPGEDAIKVARFLPGQVEIRRPLQDGVLNKGEEKKMLVLDYIVGSTVGKAPDKHSVICTCVSSPSVDGAQDSAFHRMRLEAMFKSRGWTVKVIEEGLAVILSERPTMKEMVDGVEKEAPYSGIGISFGAGRVNVVMAYKGIQVVGMSAAKSGDYVDKMVAECTGQPLSQCISFKEKELDFNNIDGVESKNADMACAYDVYYGEMIRSDLSLFSKRFTEVKSQFEFPMDIVVAGGTSSPKGFLHKLKQELLELDVPFKIKDVRHARVPRNAVVEGCLAQAIVTQKKLAEAASTDAKKLEDVS